MPKINFNVPFINELGETVMQTKIDAKKVKVNSDGRQVPQIVTNDDGTVVQEPVQVKDMLLKILTMPFEGDEKVPFGDRAKRGKLARKVMTSSSANYTLPQLTVIQELAGKAGSTTLIAQLDDLINGSDEASETADPEKAATTEKAA